MRTILATVALLTLAATTPIPTRFNSKGSDRQAIDALLATYTRAVSTKDEPLFRTLLLAPDVPFSDVGSATRPDATAASSRHFDQFRQGVFAGAPFTQRFQQVEVEQDGALAQVSLVFVNTDAHGSTWGWKTMQLLKVAGRWKIASEFYTGHP